jgi:hypothetical protein
VNTIKVEARTSLLHNFKALRECEALKTLPTDLYIVENLIVDRFLKEGRWEGPHTCFNLSTDIGRATRVDSPRSDHCKRARSVENAIPKYSISKYG